MGNRFFAATVMAGRQYLEGIGERGPWDSKRLVYWPEEAVRIALRQGIDKVARTIEDLEAEIRSSEHGLPASRVWIQEGLEEQEGRSGKNPAPSVDLYIGIHESLEDAARRLWKEERTRPRV